MTGEGEISQVAKTPKPKMVPIATSGNVEKYRKEEIKRKKEKERQSR